ncbi:lysophospholipid acyltransferase family protein [Chryseotalea sanaruensis]|uniref:lysophospholipid acyltransferase family protein n=1 Tax=Chryseotalea sanaruensis TaxID=2482724 RepID=UPI000F8F3741|nr:lysophospholipid acyltransferase family protein [Chryseotalea sanaruensis]
MTFLRWLYTAYVSVLFVLLFILLFPFFLIPIFFPRLHALTGVLNRVWAYFFFTLIAMPFSLEGKKRLDRNRQYIFVANHFSYLDIASMGFNPVNAVFVGKNDMESVPLFGFMYKKLHITVNRGSLSSRVNTLKRSMQAIDDGKSLVIFPEGGILTHQAPHMTRFKDGAFRVAIEKQIAIVPVTIPNNWIILPDQNPLLLRWGVMKVVFHEPIETKGMTLDNLTKLKEDIFNTIDKKLKHES